jgi:hypothetical protein
MPSIGRILAQFLKGRDIALRCPRRQAKRQRMQPSGSDPLCAFSWRRNPARTAQRAVPTRKIVKMRRQTSLPTFSALAQPLELDERAVTAIPLNEVMAAVL